MAFRQPFSESRTYRNSNYQQLKGSISEMLDRYVERERAAFAPSTENGKAFAADAARYRAQLSRIIGYPPPVEPSGVTAAKRVMLGEDEIATFERVYVSVAEGLDCYGILMTPKRAAGKLPVMLSLHGGGGCPELICDFERTDNYNAASRRFAELGYLTFSPLLLFSSYADGDNPPVPGNARAELNYLCGLMGTSITALEVLKLSRCIDWLVTLPNADAVSVSVAGLSYGGYYSLMLSALDERVVTTYSSCFFADQLAVARDGAMRPGSEFCWHGGGGFTYDQVAALICPRNLIIEVGMGDELFPVDGSRALAPRVRRYYDALGVGERFHYVEHAGSHEFGLGEALQYLARR